MKAALLDRNDKVIAEVFDAPSGHSVPVAGRFTIDGDAVNIKQYRISRSKRNVARAEYMQPVSRVETNHDPVWTFWGVESNTVVY